MFIQPRLGASESAACYERSTCYFNLLGGFFLYTAEHRF